tara:strand:+ start:358 stop:894 length:537 start_codon:yes stop_codon:yes gene_type:complete
MALTKVTSNVLADNAVTTGKILDSNVTTGKLAAESVTSGKLAVDSVTTSNILDSNITTGKLATSSVTSVKVGTEFTTVAVLAPGATIDVSYTAAQVFTLTPNANTTLNITNPIIGVTKTIIVTGAGGTNTIAYTVGGAAGTFNLIAGEYDDTSAKKNFIQITCVSAAEFWYSISQIAV